MSDPLIEIAEFTGKACGTIAKDLAEVSKPLAEAFRRGWHEAMAERPAGERTPRADSAPESA